MKPKILIVDDQIGALKTDKSPSLYQRAFTMRVGREAAQFLFLDGFDPLQNKYSPFYTTDAICELTRITNLDIILIDLVFGNCRTMGLEIIELLNAEYSKQKHQIPKLTLMTSRSLSEDVFFNGELYALGVHLKKLNAHYVNKHAMNNKGMFWACIHAIYPHITAPEEGRS